MRTVDYYEKVKDTRSKLNKLYDYWDARVQRNNEQIESTRKERERQKRLRDDARAKKDVEFFNRNIAQCTIRINELIDANNTYNKFLNGLDDIRRGV